MNKQGTQFAVAIIGITGLTVLTGISMVTETGPTDIMVGGLISVVTMAATYLFRLNGKAA